MTTDSARALLRRLSVYLDGFSARFSRRPQRDAASRYIDGLFDDSERKSMQAMPGRLGDAGQYDALQHFITDSPWEAARVWTHLRTCVPVRTGILALDDTGFPKQGTHSVGVLRQYCGALGKIGNCQVAVSSALIADGRTWPLAWDLYLPASWMDDHDRRPAAGIPATAVCRETWWIALAQVRTCLRRASRSPRWSLTPTMDPVLRFAPGLARLGLCYGVAIRGDAVFTIADVPGTQAATAIADSAPVGVWDTVTSGTGTQGALTARCSAVRARPAKSREDVWLLCEWSATDERKYYVLNLPETTPQRDLVALARSRRFIEQQYRELKDDLGIDHFEGRRYRGWQHLWC